MALGVDRYLNVSGAVRCCCHTLVLAVNDAVCNCKFVTTVLVTKFSAYLNTHTNVGANLVQIQCVDISRDRIVTVDEEFSTRRHSKLNVQEKYMVLRP